VYFTHFIQLQDSKVVHRRYLPGFMQRGAAFLCPAYKTGFDIGIPFMFDGDGPLKQSNMGLLLVRVKNDKKYSTTPNRALFHEMEPSVTGIFDEEEDSPVPIIRMVFALGASEGCVRVVGQQEQNPSSPEPRQESFFTAYDIWCGRACRRTFGPITESDEKYYANLLRMSYGSKGVLPETKMEQEIARATQAMQPCIAADKNWWNGQ
jgi:hypothetical protein